MTQFKKQRIVGDGVSGADMLSHVGAENPHPQYARLDQVATESNLSAHLNDTMPHSEYVVQKSEIITEYMNEENANKVVAASAIKALGNKVTTLENNFELVPSGYSAYEIEGYNTKLLGNSAFLESSVFRATRYKFVSIKNKGYYILNGELYDTLDKKHTLNNLPIELSLWTDIATSLDYEYMWSGVNNNMVFFIPSSYMWELYNDIPQIAALITQNKNIEIFQIRFGEFNSDNLFTVNSEYDAIWKHAKVFESNNFRHGSAYMPLVFLGSTSTDVYVSFSFSMWYDETQSMFLRAMEYMKNHGVLPITTPTKVYYKNSSNAIIPLPPAKQLIANTFGGKSCYILANNNTLYKLPIEEIGKSQPIATVALNNVTRVIEGFDYLIAETYNQSTYKLYKLNKRLNNDTSVDVEIHSSSLPYTSISTELNATSSFYFILSGELYKVDKDDTITKLNNLTYNLKNIWSSVVVGLPKRVGGTPGAYVYTPTAYAINDGDIYYIDDLVPHRVTTSQDWYKVDGGDSLVVGIKKNSGLASRDDNVLYKDEILQEYNSLATDTTLSAALVTQFREEYMIHGHGDMYAPMAHLVDYGDPHPQYMKADDLINAGVFVRDPLEDSVPVYRRSDTISNQNTLFIYIDTQSYSVKLENTNATGTSRVWSGISEYDNTYFEGLVSVDDDNNIQYTNIYETPQDSSKVTGTLDKTNPCNFYICNGNLCSNVITIAASANEGAKAGGWTAVTGFVFQQVIYSSTIIGHGVGVCNNELYLLNLDGTVTLVPNSFGDWTYLVGSLPCGVAPTNYGGTVWAIKDRNTLCAITRGNSSLDAVILQTTPGEYQNITMCANNSANPVFCYFISNGNLYQAKYTSVNNIPTILVNVIEDTYGDWKQVHTKFGTLLDMLVAIRDNGNLYIASIHPNNGVDDLASFKTPRPTPNNAVAKNGGWTDISASYGIFDGQLFYLNTNSGGGEYRRVLIDGTISTKWTNVTGVYTGSDPIYFRFTLVQLGSYGSVRALAICDNKAYLITNGVTAIELIDFYDGYVTDVYGTILIPGIPGNDGAIVFKTGSGIYRKEIQNSIEVSATDTSNPFKWVIRKIKSTGPTTIAASNERATATEPWDATWTLANTSVVLDMTDNGFWTSVQISSLMHTATATEHGVVRPLPDGGLEIEDGNLSVAPEVAKLHQLTTNTIPIYGYTTQNDDIIVTKGLSTIPLLSKVETLTVDTDRVWKNYTEHGANKLGIINNTALTIMPLTESLTSLEESNDSSIGCNYTIVNGKLFYIAKPVATEPVVLQQVGSDITWTKVSGMYQDLGSGKFTYAYGINNGKLYKIAELTTIVLNASSTGWSEVCGYSSNQSPNFYAYGVRSNTLYRIDNETVASVTGKTGVWLAISGIGGIYAGQPTTAYGIVYSNGLAEVCKLGATATVIPGSGAGWSQITGYTYLDNISYGIRDTYLFKITPDGVSGIDSVPGWTKISGLGYTNSGCAYGILGGQIYTIKNTTIEQVGSDIGWTDVTGDYSGAFKRYGYGLNRGRLYSLRDTTAVQLTKDSGWTKIYGRSDTMDYVVCAKLDQESYEVSADMSSGKWRLRKYTSPSYENIAVSYEPASGTNPWDCTWDNEVIVLDVVSHSGWTGIPITEFPTIGVMNDMFTEYLGELDSRFHKIDDFNTAIANYSRTDELIGPEPEFVEEKILDNYVRKTYIDEEVDPCVTESELSTALGDYIKTEDLIDSGTEVIKVSMVPNIYVTYDELSVELDKYVTILDLPSYIPGGSGGTGDVTMAWLLDPVTGLVKSTLLQDYELKAYKESGARDLYVRESQMFGYLNPYITKAAVETNYVTNVVFEEELAECIKTAEFDDFATKSWVTTRGYITELDTSNFVTTVTLNNYTLLATLNSTLTQYVKIADMGGYVGVTTAEMNAAIASAITTAQNAPIPNTTWSVNGNRTMTPGKLFTWTVTGTSSTLTASGFAASGLEYSYLQVAVASGASIAVNASINFDGNGFVDGATNIAILRNVNGTLRLVVVDSY